MNYWEWVAGSELSTNVIGISGTTTLGTTERSKELYSAKERITTNCEMKLPHKNSIGYVMDRFQLVCVEIPGNFASGYTTYELLTLPELVK